QATVTYPDGVRTTDWFLPGTVPTFGQATPTTGTTVTTGTPAATTTPGSGGEAPAAVAARPYCPGSYSFAFNPPPAGTLPDGWW
ncbi:MAG TPA: hypothetical protein VKP04_05665, partial [Ktedonobacteraceae bacterium]|nr:hypothetical protein [Ktedonobacteraceae bacterium]